MRILFFFAVISLLLAGSCNEAKRKTTVYGYEYVIHSDDSETKAQPGEFMFFHLQIRNGDSVVYRTRDESVDPPVLPFPEQEQPGRQVFPIEHVLRVMGVGDSATVFIPLDSLPETPDGFENATEMIYDVVMVDIKSADSFQSFQEERRMEAEAKAATAREKVQSYYQSYASGELESQLQSTGSGLKYLVINQGSGPRCQTGDLVSVDYFGMLEADGSEFDNSYRQGRPYTFPLGQGRSIPGYDEGVALLNEGGEALLIIPSELGYGKAGSPPVIPPDASLIFYVNLVTVQQAN